MRTLVLAAALVACGPSSSEIKTAKLAEYNTTPVAMLHIAADAAVAEGYKVGEVSEERMELITAPRFYEKEGGLQSPGADGYTQIRPGSVQVSFIVRCVVGDMNHVTVQVVPKTFQAIQGSPKPRELTPDDPNLPPWILGRADKLQLAIYERAKPYAASQPSTTSMAPPGGK